MKEKNFLSLFTKSNNEDPGQTDVRKPLWKVPVLVAAVVAVLLVISGVGIHYGTTVPVVEISVNGQGVGYAADQAQAEILVAAALEAHGQALGITAQTKDEIAYHMLRIKKKAYSEAEQAAIMAAITPYVDAYGLAVDGTVLVRVASEEVLDGVLTEYKEHYAKPSEAKTIESAEIQEMYATMVVQIPPAEVMSAQEALDLLLQGGSKVEEYTVQDGDSLWLIARKNDLLVDDILKANDGLTESTMIHPGQSLYLNQEKPYLTVISKGTSTTEVDIPFKVVTKTDTTVASGKTVVKQEGVSGKKNVTYSYVEKNGKTVEKAVINEEVIAEPVEKIVAQGPARMTVAYTNSRGSGNVSGLGWPLQGRITSYYGYRGSGFHSGIDIDGYTGQPFYAAGAGKVTFAGWKGTYGYCILIDHGDGVTTRYAHASKLLVSAGETVAKGQNIGLVGSTGRSTGSHTHFEVIINGSTTNPLNYI